MSQVFFTLLEGDHFYRCLLGMDAFKVLLKLNHGLNVSIIQTLKFYKKQRIEEKLCHTYIFLYQEKKKLVKQIPIKDIL